MKRTLRSVAKQFLLPIWQIPASSLDPETRYHGFTQARKAGAAIAPQIRIRLLPSTS
jgi:hypothetical protein